jgi:hypothetical protein
MLGMNYGKGIIDGRRIERIADVDRIMTTNCPPKKCSAEDISASLSRSIFGFCYTSSCSQTDGAEILKNVQNPTKNEFFTSMSSIVTAITIISAQPFTQTMGWELYVPTGCAEEDFKQIVSLPRDFGGMWSGWRTG